MNCSVRTFTAVMLAYANFTCLPTPARAALPAFRSARTGGMPTTLAYLLAQGERAYFGLVAAGACADMQVHLIMMGQRPSARR